jgi:hypothetical protein
MTRVEETLDGGKLRIVPGYDDITNGYFQCFQCNRVWQLPFGSDLEHETISIILHSRFDEHVTSGHTEFFDARMVN